MSAIGLQPGGRIALGAIAWLGGVAMQLQQSGLWPAPIPAALVGAAAVLVALVWRGRSAALRDLGLILALALAGFGVTAWHAGLRLADRLDPALEGRDLLLVGVVATMPQPGASGTRFVFQVDAATMNGVAVSVPARIALGWYRGFGDEAALDDPRADLRAGQRWQLPVRLKQPHGTINPHGFDAELWWFEQGLRATGYVRVAQGGAPARRLADTWAHPVEQLRQTIRDAIYRRVADPRAAGVLAALVVGDQAAIEREDWDLFRQTGIAHLVSISGVHVTMFAWLAGLAIGWGWRRSGRLMLALPAPTAARLGGVVIATGYALLAGWGIPAVRTVLMLACGALMRSFALRWPWLLVLLLAAVAVTMFDPWALLQPGFWLSFAAVGLLMASQPVGAPGADAPAAPSRWHGRLAGALGGHLRAQAVATLGLAPLSLVFFQQVSVVGFVANLVAIPLVTLAITPLALAGTLVPALWTVASALVQALVALLAALAVWPIAVWTAPTAPPWAVALGLVGALIGVAPLPWRLRALALPLAAPLLLPPLDLPAAGRFELVAADIGQGTAVLVRTRAHLLVYDAGPQYGLDSDAGERVLVPLLRARGERQVDMLVLSHRDNDHVGGAASLLAALPVRALRSSLADDHPLRARGVPHERCAAGQRWTWDGVRFEILHPAPGAAAAKANALSCVLRVEDAQGRAALVTADIEAAQESALIAREGSALASTILLVPHHGSRTSSTPAFIDAVAPRWAVVQAGYRSRFGHPAPEVVARYEQRGIELVRSDRCGAWTWRDDEAWCAREVHRRYWHWAAPAGGAEIANLELGKEASR
jgi:competence protein ComEC